MYYIILQVWYTIDARLNLINNILLFYIKKIKIYYIQLIMILYFYNFNYEMTLQCKVYIYK